MIHSTAIRLKRMGLLAIVLGMGLVSLFLLWSPTVYAARPDQTVEVGSIHKVLELEEYIQILEDKGHRWTIEDMVDETIRKPFIPYKTSHLSGSVSNSAYWVSVHLSNDGDNGRNLLLELSKPHLSHVTLYQFDPGGKMLEQVQTGRSLPFKERSIRHRNFLFHIAIQPKSELVIYARIQTNSYLQIPMRLWEVESFVEKDQYANLALGIYYGIMLVMAVYNSFLYVSLRDITYLYYVFFVLSFTLMQSVWDGLAYQFLWPSSPLWESISNQTAIVLTVLFALLFSQRFLYVSRHSPRVGKLLKVTIACIALSLPLILLMKPVMSTKWALYVATVGIFFCMLNIGVVRLKSRGSFLYSMAWLTFIAGSVLNIMAAYKLIPLTFLSLYSPRIGSVAETILLSLALADRFNSMKREKAMEEKQGILLRSLHDITKTLTSTYDMDQLLDHAIKGLSRVTGCEDGWICMKTGNGYVIKAATGQGGRIMMGQGVPDLENDAFYQKLIREKQLVMGSDMGMMACNMDLDAKTCIGVPIVYHDHVLGIMALSSRTFRTYSSSERGIIFDFAGQVAISIENIRLFHEINKMATTDGLTGAYNRAHFLKLADKEFKESMEMNKPLSMIMVDIDYFKKINDQHGHLAGDKVIQEMVFGLAKLVRKSGVIGRYGGEEFLVLLPGMGLEQAYGLAEHMRKSMEASSVPIGATGKVTFTISLGVAKANQTTESVADLINQADMALYRAKESGRNRVEQYGTTRKRQTKQAATNEAP